MRERLGRCRKTSPPAASMPSRIRWPPARMPPKLERQAPRQRPRERPSRLEQHACAPGLERHQCAPRGVAAALRDLRLVDAESPAILERQIDPSPLPIGCDVLPEVDELQRGADRVACAFVRGRHGVVQVQQQPADGIRRAAAVVEEIGGAGVAMCRDVLTERGKEVAHRRQRQPMSRDRRGELGKRRGVGHRSRTIASSACSNASSSAIRCAGVASPSSAMSSAARAKR